MVLKNLSRGVLIAVLFIFGLWDLSVAQHRYSNKPVLEIIEEIEKNSSLTFLYRDALIADIRLTFNTDERELVTDFQRALLTHELILKVDSTRNQAIIYRENKDSSQRETYIINGQVVDASTGERLPFATIIWRDKDTIKGVSSNESGSFTINRPFEQHTLEIKCSYVGYASKTISVDLAQSTGIHELTFRLQPQRIDGNEIIATGRNYYDDINRKTSELVDLGTYGTAGETNALRALQVLPSVSLIPAVSDGLHVRGSPNDGFQVLIDGISIYNQSHLFGLVDSFNSDILQRSGFFYDVVPVQFQAPPGGTLSLLTKTGSLNRFSGTAGSSNSALRLSLGGPIKKGSSSWLISGRKSYMNSVDWFNNSGLIKWGLDVERDHQVLEEGLTDFESTLVRPGETDASFFDLHTKLYFEGERGNRFILSGYFGGDDTRQEAERLFRSFSSSSQNRFEYRPITTTNDWQNGAAGLQYQQWLSDQTYSSSTLGISIYQTEFSKDDFTYVRTEPALQAIVFPFRNRSVLNDVKFDQRLEFSTSPWLWTTGLSYNFFLGEYFEASFDRPGFFDSQKAHKIDVYGQLDYTGLDILDVFAGIRMHYYSSGNYLKWSPRIKLQFFPESMFSFGGGFSQNHQFMNAISLTNTITPDVWILASENQPPTSVDYYSAAMNFAPADWLYAQAEGYIKRFKHVRLHEINTFSLSNTYNSNPWLINNYGLGQGVEFLLQNKLGFLTLSQMFTISEMMLVNADINEGQPFYADWDRTYRYTTSLEINPVTDFTLYLTWMYSTGTPNRLATFGPQSKQRLSDYRRADVAAEYKKQLKKGHINLSFSIFNILDRQNSWYRELMLVIDQYRAGNRFRSVPVNVYDMGIQPSFNMSVAF